MSRLVLLAHTRALSASARAIAAELRRLGYDVSRIAPPAGGSRGLKRRLAACQRLLMVCSREAGIAAALRSVAASAEATGKLVVLQIDASVSRNRPGFARPAPYGRRRAAQWRRLIGGVEEFVQPRRVGIRAPRHTWRLVGTAAALLGLAASAVGYVGDAAFAARVDELACMARAQAAMFVNGLIG